MNDRELRPAVGTLLIDENVGGAQRKQVVTKVTETDDMLTVYSVFTYTYKGETSTSRHSHKRKKFLAIGGPLAGTRVVEAEAQFYTLYNRASRWRVQGPAPVAPKAVLIWNQAIL